MEFFAWLNHSAFSAWVRESGSLLGYPGFITLHSYGMGFLVGANAVIDLRVLGVARRVPLAPLEKFFPIMYAGFWINAVSGLVLFIADASKWAVHPVFLTKLVLVALGVLNIWLLRACVFGDKANLASGIVSTKSKILAGTSLAIWAATITAGRLTAYLGTWSDLAKLFTTHG